MENIVQVENLCKKIDNFYLKNISFELKPGDIMGLIGENGSGKSTIINLLLNILKKDAGNIEFFDQAFSDQALEIKNQIGFVLSNAFIYEKLTPIQFGKFISSFYKRWDNDLYRYYLSRYKIDYKKKIEQFSSGMVTKLKIALALSHHAKLLVLDEPTVGLDPSIREDILEDFLMFQKENSTSGIILSSHIFSDLEKIANKVTLIDDGKMLISDSLKNIGNNYAIIEGDLEILPSIRDKLSNYLIQKNHFLALINTVRKKDLESTKGITVCEFSIEKFFIIMNKGMVLC